MDSTVNTNKRRAAAGAVAGALGGAAAYFTTQQLQTLLAATGGASAADPGTGLLMTALRLLLAASAAFLLLWWMGVPGAALGAPFALLLQLAVEAVVVPSVVSWVSASWFALVLDYIRPEGPVVFVVLLAAVMAIAVPAGAMAVDRERSPAAR